MGCFLDAPNSIPLAAGFQFKAIAMLFEGLVVALLPFLVMLYFFFVLP
jgi:hypothetical protein